MVAWDISSLLTPAQPQVTDLYDLSTWALQTRAGRGALELEEAERLLNRLNMYDAWSRVGAPYPPSPFPIGETLDILELGIFMGSTTRITHHEDGAVMSVLIDRKTETSIGTTVALNVVGLSLLAATGVGFTAGPEKEEIEVYLIVGISPGEVGSFLEFLVQQRGGKPKPVPKKGPINELTTAIVKDLSRIAANWALLSCIYGGWFTPAYVPSISQAALARRLHDLGPPVADRWQEILARVFPIEPSPDSVPPPPPRPQNPGEPPAIPRT